MPLLVPGRRVTQLYQVGVEPLVVPAVLILAGPISSFEGQKKESERTEPFIKRSDLWAYSF